MVIVNLETNRIFALNETGSRFWELLAEGKSLPEIRETLTLGYAVDGLTLQQEIDELVSQLQAEALVEETDES